MTLIEIAVALGILGIISALAVATMGGMRPRMDINSMSVQFAAKVGEAQAKALRDRRDVWLIVYVNSTRDPAKNGGYFIYEPLSDNFSNFATYSVSGGPAAQRSGDVVASQLWFGQGVTSGRVSFADPPTALPLTPYFVGNAQACSFCSANADGLRGAMVFSPEGEVTFRNGNGVDLGVSQGVVALTSNINANSGQAAIAVSASGLTRVVK